MRTLDLTSTTLMHGPDVRRAQQALTKNDYGAFRPGPIDGEWGESSARAAKRAKYWVGYPNAKINPLYGDRLHAILTGKTKLSPLQVLRRKRRLARQAQTPLRAVAFDQAARHVGVKESPAGSNKVLFSTWYGVTGPWCAMFVTYCYTLSGSKAFNRDAARWAYTPFMLADARAGVNGLAATDDPQRGDVVLFDWEKGGPTAQHVGLFDAWIVEGQTFKTIEGNTSSTNQSDGGAVERRERTVGLVAAFVHVSK